MIFQLIAILSLLSHSQSSDVSCHLCTGGLLYKSQQKFPFLFLIQPHCWIYGLSSINTIFVMLFPCLSKFQRSLGQVFLTFFPPVLCNIRFSSPVSLVFSFDQECNISFYFSVFTQSSLARMCKHDLFRRINYTHSLGLHYPKELYVMMGIYICIAMQGPRVCCPNIGHFVMKIILN